MSTEAQVRTRIVDAIKSIATMYLDFDLVGGNVHPYLLEYQAPEKSSQYLMAEVDGKKTARAWGVQVLSVSEEVLATGGRYSRLYEVIITGYYSHDSGADVNRLIDHASAVRGAVKDLGITLDGAIDLIEDIQPLSIGLDDSAAGRLLVGTIVYRFRTQQPGYY